jgi:hypothetical protein
LQKANPEKEPAYSSLFLSQFSQDFKLTSFHPEILFTFSDLTNAIKPYNPQFSFTFLMFYPNLKTLKLLLTIKS